MVGLESGLDLSGKTMAERRRAIAECEKARFVDAETFCSMVVSYRKLNRADESTAALRGLHCQEEDMYYFIEEERLERYWAMKGEMASACELV